MTTWHYYGDANQLRNYLSSMADHVVDRVMRAAESSGRHEAGSWVYEGDRHHIQHALDHALAYANGRGDATEELEHLITRAAMALWSLRSGVLGDFGDEGKGHYDGE